MKTIKGFQVRTMLIPCLAEFLLLANWGIAVGLRIAAAMGKGHRYLPLFWDLDVVFCPVLCATIAGLIVFRHFRHRSTFVRAASLACTLGFGALFGLYILFGLIALLAFPANFMQ
ncbi:MAG TPA: hypothetical protein VG754_07325 [Verrucomicrobiae bacterium]|jgi:hypothetical protein|nr:hypothetical protein [Verrucomicrobiae bacterium]